MPRHLVGSSPSIASSKFTMDTWLTSDNAEWGPRQWSDNSKDTFRVDSFMDEEDHISSTRLTARSSTSASKGSSYKHDGIYGKHKPRNLNQVRRASHSTKSTASSSRSTKRPISRSGIKHPPGVKTAITPPNKTASRPSPVDHDATPRLSNTQNGKLHMTIPASPAQLAAIPTRFGLLSPLHRWGGSNSKDSNQKLAHSKSTTHSASKAPFMDSQTLTQSRKSFLAALSSSHAPSFQILNAKGPALAYGGDEVNLYGKMTTTAMSTASSKSSNSSFSMRNFSKPPSWMSRKPKNTATSRVKWTLPVANESDSKEKVYLNGDSNAQQDKTQQQNPLKEALSQSTQNRNENKTKDKRDIKTKQYCPGGMKTIKEATSKSGASRTNPIFASKGGSMSAYMNESLHISKPKRLARTPTKNQDVGQGSQSQSKASRSSGKMGEKANMQDDLTLGDNQSTSSAPSKHAMVGSTKRNSKSRISDFSRSKMSQVKKTRLTIEDARDILGDKDSLKIYQPITGMTAKSSTFRSLLWHRKEENREIKPRQQLARTNRVQLQQWLDYTQEAIEEARIKGVVVETDSSLSSHKMEDETQDSGSGIFCNPHDNHLDGEPHHAMDETRYGQHFLFSPPANRDANMTTSKKALDNVNSQLGEWQGPSDYDEENDFGSCGSNKAVHDMVDDMMTKTIDDQSVSSVEVLCQYLSCTGGVEVIENHHEGGGDQHQQAYPDYTTQARDDETDYPTDIITLEPASVVAVANPFSPTGFVHIRGNRRRLSF